MRKLLFAIICTVLSLNNFIQAQCSMYPVTLQSRIANSAFVVEAKVIAKKSFWNNEGNYLFTSNLLEVANTFKGQLFATKIELITEGGELGLIKQVVEPSLQLNIGDEGVFTLNSYNNLSQYGFAVFTAYADMQGFIKYDPIENSANEPFKKYNSLQNDLYPVLESLLNIKIASNASNTSTQKTAPATIAAVTGISPTTITAGTATSLTITGTGFGATQGTSIVEFRNADDGGATFVQPHSSQYLSWSATQIVVQVPTRTSSGGTLTTSGTAGTGQVRVTVAGSPTLSAQTLTVSYGHLNAYYFTNNAIYNTRHVALNGAGGITWRMFTGFDGNATAKASFLRAFQSWRCATYINWQMGSTTTTNTIALDGTNIVRFDVGAELPVGVLGRCTSYFNGCIVGPNVFFFVSELDIVFDSGANWQFGPAAATGVQYDFESVAVHELGHGHQLSHVINSIDVMHYSIANAQNKRVLNTDDINGGTAVMTRNLSGAICSQPMMVALNSTNCALAAPTASFNVTSPVCVNQTVTLTDLSSNTPTSWLWGMPGGTPNTATVQNTSTSYSAPGIYTISLIAANSTGTSTPITKTLQVLASPTINVSGTATICAGNSTTLTASGASTYTWNPSGLTGASQVFSPSSATVYTVTGSNGACTSIGNYTVSVNPLPTTSAAGSSQTICATTATLSGNTPAVGTGSWTVVSGIATITTPTSPNSGVTGLGVGNTIFQWAISNSCGTSTSTVSIVRNNTPTIANAGASQTICASSATLSGNTPAVGAGIWTLLSGSGTITSPSSATSGVTALATGVNVFQWTISNGVCPASSSTVAIRRDASPTISNAGSSQTICATTATLAGNTPAVGTGAWTLISGAATISNSVSPISTVSGIGTGNNVFQWTISNGVCPASSSTVAIIRNVTPTVNVASSASLICVGQSNTLTASGATTYTFNPGGTTTNPAVVSPTSTVTYTVAGATAGCVGSRTLTLVVSPCTEITALEVSQSIKIYPNPAQNNVTLDFGSSFSGSVTLYNAVGQLILSKSLNESKHLSLDLSSYAKGIYVISLKNEQGKITVLKVIHD